MSELGAYSKFNHVYSQAVIKDLIEFARYRGVRIIPEFDTPGHTESWGPGAGDGFLTKCCDSKGVPDGTVGPIDPSVQANYDLMKTLFGEVKELFKDEFIHLGGDEVPFNCWKSNPNITKDSLNRPNNGTMNQCLAYGLDTSDILSPVRFESRVRQVRFEPSGESLCFRGLNFKLK